MNGSNQVAQWSDLSGSGNHFLQSTTANKPVYGATAAPNGMPALTFTSTSSQYLSLATLSSSLSFASGVSAFAQASYSATQTSQGWQGIFDFGNGTGSDNLMMGRYANTANNYYEGWKGTTGDQTYTTTSPIVNSSENTYEAIQQAGTAGTLTAVAHYLAGTAQTATGAAGSSQTWVPASIARTSNFLGRSNWAADNYLSGTLSEVLIYNTALNNTQRVILENYLAAEWNQTISSRKYTPPTSTTYATNLVGIGYSGTDYFATDLAGSTDGLGFSSGTTAADFLGTTGYLMAAHNAQSNTVITNASVPGIVSGSALSRWNRSWYLQPSAGNSPGAASVVFNFADYNSSSPASANTYTLLYNATDVHRILYHSLQCLGDRAPRKSYGLHRQSARSFGPPAVEHRPVCRHPSIRCPALGGWHEFQVHCIRAGRRRRELFVYRPQSRQRQQFLQIGITERRCNDDVFPDPQRWFWFRRGPHAITVS